MGKAEITILSSMSFKDSDLAYCPVYYMKLIRDYAKLVFFFVFNKKRYIRTREGLKLLKARKGHRFQGHGGILYSLFRGLSELGIPYRYNKITKDTKYIFLNWSNLKDLEKLARLKKKYGFKVIACPTVAGPFTEILELIKRDCIDIYCSGSDWARRWTLDSLEKQYHNKVVVWPSGVELMPSYRAKQPRRQILFYCKRVLIDDDIIQYAEQLGIKCNIIKTQLPGFKKYRFYEYDNFLKQSDFVIFYQNIPETQGLAIAEAWARDIPTVIKDNVNEYGASTAPYMHKENGLFYKSGEELKKIIFEYNQDPEKFLKRFAPQKHVIDDRESVKRLLDLFHLENKQ